MLAALITGAVGMTGGLLAVAWKLGGIERAVLDLSHRLQRVEDWIDAEVIRRLHP